MTEPTIPDELEYILNWLSPGSAYQRKLEAIERLTKLISKREIEARKEELKSLESNMISSDSQWFAIGERIAQLTELQEGKE